MGCMGPVVKVGKVTVSRHLTGEFWIGTSTVLTQVAESTPSSPVVEVSTIVGRWVWLLAAEFGGLGVG